MTKIKIIELQGFRGVRHSFRLDLTPKGRSIAIFGDNGSGKSSITDSIEWFFTGRVKHHWREDCKAEALRNVHLKSGENSTVMIEFYDGPAATIKSLDSSLESWFDPDSTEIASYVTLAATERIIFRNQDLTQFVGMTKGEKRRVVADIIGYEDVSSFRDTIQQVLNSLKGTPEYVAAKETIDMHRGELLRHCGEIITTSD
jgi:AAA15 family ATPase/GTPase